MGEHLVVGAGVAGCAVAARLVDLGADRVIVCEGGGDVAGSLPVRRSGVDVDYQFGRGWGGSSLINGGVMNPAADPGLFADVEFPLERPAIGRVGQALRDRFAGAAPVRLLRRGGERVTMADVLLDPVSSAVERVDGEVDRVVIERRRAVGVVLASGERLMADSVVCCAGVFGTPALLARSGFEVDGSGICDHPSAVLSLAGPRRGAPEFSVVVPRETTVGGRRRIGEHLALEAVGADAAYAAIATALLNPVARGRIVCRGDDLDVELGNDAADIDALVALLDPLVTWLADGSLGAVTIDAHGTPLDAIIEPAPRRSWVADTPGSYFHAVGTCADLVSDAGGVTGYERLFIGDAAGVSAVSTSNMMAFLVAVGRRVADAVIVAA